ncbi:MAG: cytidine deaminase family protein [Acutalibacteraceae bacterium]
MTFDELYKLASEKAVYRKLGRQTTAGYVGAALLTDKGNIYTGINIDAPCSVGFCAEHSAIAAMVSAGESRVVKMVAVSCQGEIWPPCGRCREFLVQINDDNEKCEVLLPDKSVTTIAELLPHRWN